MYLFGASNILSELSTHNIYSKGQNFDRFEVFLLLNILFIM